MKEHKFEIFFGIVLFTLLLSVAIFFAGGKLLNSDSNDDKPNVVVTSQIILDKINDEAFIVTKTIFLDQKKTIRIDQGSDWSNFWWGQTITTEGIIRVDLGVDYKLISENDIAIDEESKTISINVPEATILDASLFGDLNVETSSGILRQLFASDRNKDYNLALQSLIEDASETVIINQELVAESENESLKILQLVLSDLGYRVVSSSSTAD